MNIKQIKETITCLDYLGKPAKKVAHGYLYHAPWREDKHPSLSVTPDGRGWHDLATGAKGSVIDLVMMHLNTRDFRRVIEELEKFRSDSFSFPQSNTSDGEKEKGLDYTRFELVPLQSRGLYAYLHKRGINIGIARQFLQEAHYSFQERTDGSYLYALAYPNDLGGYELRGAPYTGNPDGYKGGIAPKGISTHLDKENAPTVVFEGFMDMLSWVTMTDGVKHNLVVMNSVTNKEETVDMLRSISGTIYLCLDNDKAGEEATAFIKNALPSAIDYRSHYADHKDVNEFLVKHKCGI
ncbi:MAG: toprim domain-containing protein [Prevotella sp.]|nr:toprim domain-containing protein [Prevotella sp.]